MNQEELTLEEKEKLKSYFNDCTKELYMRKSVVVLKHMTKKEAEYIFELAKKNKSIVPRTIEYKSKPTVFLKYHKECKDVDWSKLLKQAQKEYAKGNLDEALRIYKGLIQIIPRPNSFILYRIGLLYLKHQQRKPALLYLNIALGLSKKENKEHTEELEGLIFNITNNIPLEDQKDTRYILMDEEDFQENDKNKKLEDIAALIKEDNLNLNDTCNNYNLTIEETLLVKLIYARNSYASKNFTVGDKTLKEVEKSKDKTENIKVLLKEVTANKKMYQYRQNKN